MSRFRSPTGTPPPSDGGGVPARGCIVALVAPFVVVLIAVGTLMVLGHRQEAANARHEDEALRQTSELAGSYADDLLDEARGGVPDESRTRELARRYHGTPVSHTSSGRSLTTVVRFAAAYEDTTFFGTSDTFAARCYSFRFDGDAGGGVRRRVLPLQECHGN